MARTVYLNGDYLPEDEARVSIFDRGFLMAVGVYEVTSVLGGKLVDFPGHARRLTRSLEALESPATVRRDASGASASWTADSPLFAGPGPISRRELAQFAALGARVPGGRRGAGGGQIGFLQVG